MGLNVIGPVCAPATELATDPPTAATKAAPAHLFQKLLIVPPFSTTVFSNADSLTSAAITPPLSVITRGFADMFADRMMHTGESMSSKLLAALASTTFFLPALYLAAQQPAPRPIQAMPYSPSLDVTSLDRAVDPCVDFYKFSCGGWQKNNPIPADQSGWSVYARLGNENQQFLWGILEADAKAKNRTPVQQKVGDYFAACMNTSAIDALGLKPVQS